MTRKGSITRRLIVTVLVLEVLAAGLLIIAVTTNERINQYRALDANLRGTAHALFGAVQEDDTDNVMLDLSGISLPREIVFRVVDDHGRVLGSRGEVASLELRNNSFETVKQKGKRSYRYFALEGERIIDPAKGGGFHHRIFVLCGQPDSHVWHEVIEATRFFTLATAILIGLTAWLMVWQIRRSLSPILVLAAEANRINAHHWKFEPPEIAGQFVELHPLVLAIDNTIKRLQQSFEQQERFTRDAAHELKTDLAIVKSSLQLMTMKHRSPEEYEIGLRVALDDFTRLEATVQQMLTLARLEQPADAVQTSCLLDHVLQDAVAQSSAFASVKQVLLMASPIAICRVPINTRDASLLCSNLILNALQHSPEKQAVHIGLRNDGSYAILQIRDHGEGIREEDLPHLFEPFYRGDPSRSRKSGGTGLGLSICKAICERAGGSIHIANHENGGAVVTAQLPII